MERSFKSRFCNVGAYKLLKLLGYLNRYYPKLTHTIEISKGSLVISQK